ncbi:MAG: SPOR domain-containing protein [Steroidobacteraceae bacterium]
MERQLKERLIGAAVIVAAAVIILPSMFEGSGSRPAPVVATDSASSGQIKTYRVELQAPATAQPAAVAQAAPIEVPAERPQDELPASDVDQSNVAVASSSAISQSVASVAAVVTPKPTVVAPPAPVKVESPKQVESSKQVEPQVKPTAGNWVVQVGSFSAEDRAQQIVSQLKGQGYPAFAGSVKVGGKTLYRVRVGAVAERAAAESILQKLKATYPGASVVPANR